MCIFWKRACLWMTAVIHMGESTSNGNVILRLPFLDSLWISFMDSVFLYMIPVIHAAI